MVSLRVEILEQTIDKLHQVKHSLEKELHYDWSVTDDIGNIIEALEFDLGFTQEQDKERSCE